jgi:CheY-like chemotaxis protein
LRATPRTAGASLGYPGLMRSFRVLLVDPIADDWELQAVVLRGAGFDVVEPGPNAIHTAIAERPDAIVVDVSPRRMGAMDFVREVKADARTSVIPVILVSAYPQSDLPRTEGFVGKPSAPGALLDELARVLEGQRV